MMTVTTPTGQLDADLGVKLHELFLLSSCATQDKRKGRKSMSDFRHAVISRNVKYRLSDLWN